MYGDRVHKSVKDSGDHETGISIHYVNENYDEGSIIFQSKVEVGEQDSIEDIAKSVRQLEYKHYPEVIQKFYLKKCRVEFKFTLMDPPWKPWPRGLWYHYGMEGEGLC